MSFFHNYSQLLLKRPYVTNMLTTGFLFGTGDCVAQTFFEKDAPKHYDYLRTLRAAVYGGVFFAPLGDKWYKVLNRINIHGSKSPGSKLASLAARVGLDQLVFAPFIAVPMYYTVMSILELNSQPLAVVSYNLRHNWWSTLKTNWMVWPAVQILNFSVVPVQFRLLFVNLVSIGWNCFLSLLLNKERKTNFTL